MTGKRSDRRSRNTGCGFLVLTCLFTCFFLVLNSALVAKLYPTLVHAGPRLLHGPRVAQVIMFVTPVVLVFLEWWVVDLVVDLLAPLSRRSQPDRPPHGKRRGR